MDLRREFIKKLQENGYTKKDLRFQVSQEEIKKAFSDISITSLSKS